MVRRPHRPLRGAERQVQPRRRRRVERGGEGPQARARRPVRLVGHLAPDAGTPRAASATASWASSSDFTVKFTHGGEALPDRSGRPTRRSACRSEGSPDRDLRHRHGLAGGPAQGGRARRARLRRARLPADVDAAGGAADPGASRASGPRTSTGRPTRSWSATSAARITSRCWRRRSASIPLESFPSLFGKLFLETGGAARRWSSRARTARRRRRRCWRTCSRTPGAIRRS